MSAFYNDGENDFFLAQVSFTFISVSVLSILSDKSKRIYWKNLVEESLVLPKWRSFFSLSAYAFVALVGSLVAILLDNVISLTVFFAIGIVSISILSIKILIVYHDERGTRGKLENTYHSFLLSEVSWNDREERQEFVESYRYIWETMEINTHKAIQEEDYETVYSNLKFYCKNAYTLTDDFVCDIISFYNKRVGYEVMHFLKCYVRDEASYFFSVGWDAEKIKETDETKELWNIQRLCHRNNIRNGKIRYNSSYTVEQFLKSGIIREILKNNKSRNVCKEFSGVITYSLLGLYNHILANCSKITDCSKFGEYIVDIESVERDTQRNIDKDAFRSIQENQIIGGMNSLIPKLAFHCFVDEKDIVPFYVEYVDMIRCYIAELILDSIIDDEQAEMLYQYLKPVSYIFIACKRYLDENKIKNKFDDLKERVDKYEREQARELLNLITGNEFLFYCESLPE